MRFKSVYSWVTNIPTSFFGSFLCLESKTMFILEISLTVLSKTHQVAIPSVRDMNMEVWEIIEGKTFVALFYVNLAHLSPRYKKKSLQGALLNNY